MNRALSTLIFDLDGTLIDSMPVLAGIFTDLLADRRGVPREFSRGVYFAMAGIGPEWQFREVLRRAHLYESGAKELTEEFWRLAAAVAAPPFPEVPGVLEKLRAGGYALGVSSGGRPDFAKARAKRAGIDGFFRLILGTDDGDPAMAKGPGHFRMIREALGLPEDGFRASAAMVGDGAFDMQVASKEGITVIGRLTGNNGRQLRDAGAEYLIADLTELLTLLGLS